MKRKKTYIKECAINVYYRKDVMHIHELDQGLALQRKDGMAWKMIFWGGDIIEGTENTIIFLTNVREVGLHN